MVSSLPRKTTDFPAISRVDQCHHFFPRFFPRFSLGFSRFSLKVATCHYQQCFLNTIFLSPVAGVAAGNRTWNKGSPHPSRKMAALHMNIHKDPLNSYILLVPVICFQAIPNVCLLWELVKIVLFLLLPWNLAGRGSLVWSLKIYPNWMVVGNS